MPLNSSGGSNVHQSSVTTSHRVCISMCTCFIHQIAVRRRRESSRPGVHHVPAGLLQFAAVRHHWWPEAITRRPECRSAPRTVSHQSWVRTGPGTATFGSGQLAPGVQAGCFDVQQFMDSYPVAVPGWGLSAGVNNATLPTNVLGHSNAREPAHVHAFLWPMPRIASVAPQCGSVIDFHRRWGIHEWHIDSL